MENKPESSLVMSLGRYLKGSLYLSVVWQVVKMAAAWTQLGW